MTAIRIENLTKSFGSTKRALNSVSLTIEPGECVALIGASGSGKSTLIRHISGLLTADAKVPGQIEIFGETVQQNGRLSADIRRIRRDIGLVFQQFNLVGRLSVLTNVLAGGLGRMPAWRGCLGIFTYEEQQLAMQALERVGIAETARQRAATLSGGQQQRAAIARALVQRARILAADEPVASLDPVSARRVMETLAYINGHDGITTVVSLHQVEYARRYCTRAIALESGRIVFDGPSRELTTARLREIYKAASEELILPGAEDFPAQH